jgi:hypothetical protein
MAQVDSIADTSAVILLMRGDPAVQAVLRDKDFAVTFINLG